jgi:CheY-like chemotaxis protein
MRGPAYRPRSSRADRQSVVLVVEDETLVRNTTAEYLRLSGYVVIEAANAAEAVAVFVSGEPVDIVFSDVHLPGGMDGLKLATWIRRHHCNIPVMLTSGHADAPRLAELVGEESFASKPYRQKEVVSRIRSLLEKA